MDIKLNRTESQPDIDFEKRNFILVSSDPLSDLMPDFTGKIIDLIWISTFSVLNIFPLKHDSL